MKKIRLHISRLLAQAKTINQRLFIVLSGERLGCNHFAEQIIETANLETVLVFNALQTVLPNSRPSKSAHSYLGHNTDAIIFDAYGGFDPDAFGILTGTINGGGLFILISPALSNWPTYPDPENNRLAIYPLSGTEISANYLHRIVRIIKANTVSLYQNPHFNCYLLPIDKKSSDIKPLLPTKDQLQCILTILNLAQKQTSPSTLLITADRGRGKSSAMGLAAAELIKTKVCKRIVVCAPSKKILQTFFKHANNELKCVNEVQLQEKGIRFFAPDALLLTPPKSDLLMIDEAAAIPLPVLQKMLELFPKIVFSSTFHGYEGAGRGFSLRFSQMLDQCKTNWRKIKLTIPVRYAMGDKLEELSNKLLMLDAELEAIDVTPELQPARSQLIALESNQLITNEEQLRTIFSLFIQAHYQTKPLDLRHILDGPNLKTYCLYYNNAIVGSALIAIEGAINDPSLQNAIMHGERRPYGHLLPQILSYHHLQAEYLSFKICRIVRIVIHPSLQKKGFGSLLLQKLESAIQQEQFDAFGASFGYSKELCKFWTKNAYQTVHQSSKKNASSGAKSSVVLKPVSSAATLAFNKSRQRYLYNQESNFSEGIMENDIQEIKSYALRRRDFEASKYALKRYFSQYPNNIAELPTKQAGIVKHKVLENESWQWVSTHYQLTGRRACEDQLKAALKMLLLKAQHSI